MDTTEIRQLLRRLARPHGEGRLIVEGTAIRADGSDYDAVEAWILANGGAPEVVAKRPPSGGLHGGHFSGGQAGRNLGTPRFVLPLAAIDEPADEEDSSRQGSSPEAEPGGRRDSPGSAEGGSTQPDAEA